MSNYKKIKKVPRYYFFRIILVSGFIYVMLVFPFASIVRIGQFSEIINFNELKNNHDSICEQDNDIIIHLGLNKQNIDGEKFERPKLVSRTLHKIFMWISFIAIIALNAPFKLYFYRLRKKKPISEKLKWFVRKKINNLPFYNIILFFTLPTIANIIGLFEIGHTTEPIYLAEKQLFGIYIVAALLIAAFAYYWQKNRLQFFYLEHIYTPEELRQPTDICGKTKNISKYFLSVNLIMILLPIIIIMFYLSMSISTFTSLGISEFNESQKTILLGNILSSSEIFDNTDNYEYGLFINADNTYLMIWGLIQTMISTVIYLLFFLKWTTRLVVKPIKHLLKNMQITTEGNMENFAIVRSNDEIGQLATEYNKMSIRLKTYFDEVTDLNKNLEKKVIIRTTQINEQKEEIEAQRDDLIDKNTEIEAQKDDLLEKNIEIEAQNEEIKTQRDELSKQKKGITDSINYAKHIQKAVIASENIFPTEKMFIFFKPRDIVSGDFYYQKIIGNRKLIAAVDCTGHGVPGAFMSMLGVTFLNQIVKNEIDKASDILEELRENVKFALQQANKEEQQKDGMDIALCIINEEKMTLNYAGANNPLYIIRKEEVRKEEVKFEEVRKEGVRKEENFSPLTHNSLIVLKPDRQPIGTYIKERAFKNHEIKIENNDLIYIFSDGYQDQFGGEKGGKFMSKNFKSLLLEISQKPIPEQNKILEQTFEKWRGNIEQIDDVLVMGVKI